MSRFLERVSRGVCGRCGKIEVSGKSICHICNQNIEDKRKKRNQNGICHDCDNFVKSGSLRCDGCLEKRRLRQSDRKSQGICRDCNEPVKDGFARCEAHRAKMREWYSVHAKNMLAKKHLGDVGKWAELQNLFDQQDGKCAYSGLPITIGEDAHIDHIVPTAKGGKNEIDNYQWVSKKVNFMKGGLLEEEFLLLCKLITFRMKG